MSANAQPLPSISLFDRLATFRAAGKIAGVVLLSALAVPLQALLMRFSHGPAAFVVPQLWHRGVCALLGLHVEVVGRRHDGPRTAYVGNHISHFDIVVLGRELRASFIAKDEMEGWPGMKFFAGLQQTVFISRDARRAATVAGTLSRSMQRGHNLVLFAEGTTSSGAAVAPFKSSLFSVLVDGGNVNQWTLQPFTLDLLEVDGHPLHTAADRDLYAYYGDMDAGAQAWRFLKSRGARLRLVLHPPLRASVGMTRKMLAAETHRMVASGLAS